MENSSFKNRLLVIHQGALGDIVCVLPHILAAKETLNFEADFFCQAPYLALLKKLGIAKGGTGIESGAIAGLFSANPPQQALNLLRSYDAAIYFGKSPEFEASLKRVIPQVYSFAPRPAPDQRVNIGKALAQLFWFSVIWTNPIHI
ncbi:MAG: hypothetical protein QMD09_08390 [Desulfatibacillaceae bacterium]|nr:hypothetical protein [Desulfatibacillaceae bacterium]